MPAIGLMSAAVLSKTLALESKQLQLGSSSEGVSTVPMEVGMDPWVEQRAGSYGTSSIGVVLCPFAVLCPWAEEYARRRGSMPVGKNLCPWAWIYARGRRTMPMGVEYRNSSIGLMGDISGYCTTMEDSEWWLGLKCGNWQMLIVGGPSIPKD